MSLASIAPFGIETNKCRKHIAVKRLASIAPFGIETICRLDVAQYVFLEASIAPFGIETIDNGMMASAAFWGLQSHLLVLKLCQFLYHVTQRVRLQSHLLVLKFKVGIPSDSRVRGFNRTFWY